MIVLGLTYIIFGILNIKEATLVSCWLVVKGAYLFPSFFTEGLVMNIVYVVILIGGIAVIITEIVSDNFNLLTSLIALLCTVDLARICYVYSIRDSQDAIEQTIDPEKYITPIDGMSNDDDSIDCVICIDQITVNAVKIDKCGHIFHNGCIQPWLKQNPQCPICRVNVVMGRESIP